MRWRRTARQAVDRALERVGLEVRRRPRATLRADAPLTRHLVATGQLSKLRLLDIGCSGGVHPRWEALGPALDAVGVDVVLSEVGRLQADAPPGVAYRAARVGPEREGALPRRSAYPRSSAAWAAAHHPRRVAGQIVDNDWADQPLVPTTETVDLTSLLTPDVDVIKLDIDGADFAVLEAAGADLADSTVLALDVEVFFHGEAGPGHHTFHNTDRLLRSLGFQLMSLAPRRYSSAALPAPFVYDLYAQTASGRCAWADALYMRDVVARPPPFSLEPPRLARLCVLGELYGLPDVAAEIIQAHPAAFDSPEWALDLLTPLLDGHQLSYTAYRSRFERDPEGFMPHRRPPLARHRDE